jgi:hypothetical protein
MFALLSGAIAVYCLLAARMMQHSGEANSSEAAAGLRIARYIFVPITLIYALCAFGLWRSARWAKWVSALFTAAFAGIFIQDILTGDRDPDNWIMAIALAILLITVLLARLRHPADGTAIQSPNPGVV